MDNLLEAARGDEQVEFEASFGPYGVDEEGFRRVLRALGAAAGFVGRRAPPQLDVTASTPARLTVVGAADVGAYCRSGGAAAPTPTAVAIEKSAVMEPVRHPDLGLVFHARREKRVDDVVGVARALARAPSKNFRHKQRISFTSPEYAFRVDCTVVAQSTGAVPRLDAPPRFEIEVELVDRAPPAAELSGQLTRLLEAVYKNLEASPFVVGAAEKAAVLAEVRALAGAAPIGPKPATLTWEHLLPPSEGRVSVLEGYTVTDKADGDRAQLYIARDGRAFLVYGGQDVRFTGMDPTPALAGTLVDGEHVRRWRVAAGADLVAVEQTAFLAFDIYFHAGEPVSAQPLWGPVGGGAPVEGSRVARLEALAASLASASKAAFVQFRAKRFFAGDGDDLLAAARRVLDADPPYETDGIILTPALLPVGANYESEKPSIRAVAWRRALKWKPPEKNSIDFLVRFMGPADLGDGVARRTVRLMVGAPERVSADILTVLAAVPAPKRAGDLYGEREFATVVLQEGARCSNGDPVRDGTIVEFTAEVLDGEITWRPLRARRDKTQVLERTGGIGGAANDIRVAQGVLASVLHPVTSDMITGRAPVPEYAAAAADEALYYARDTERGRLASLPMLEFHNAYVKKGVLIAPLARAAGLRSVLDIGCGKGGDLQKYLGAGFTSVVGLDLAEDNLTNPDDGAYVRLAEARERKHASASHMVVFSQWDCSLPIAREHAGHVRNPTLRELNAVIFGFVPQTKVPRALARYYRTAQAGFDAVSCQFAIHYFFRDAAALDALCSNVATRLRAGGLFVGTALDALEVDALFRRSDTAVVKGRKDNKVIWTLTKRYDTLDDDVGKQVLVFLESINQTLPEYLVDYGLLRAALARHGLSEPSPKTLSSLGLTTATGLFSELYERAQGDDAAGPRVKEALRGMSPDEKRWSFMNRWFVFEKKSSGDL
jgi:SAM-dependent methyltransferase